MQKIILGGSVIILATLISACGNNKGGYLNNLEQGVELLEEVKEISNDDNPYQKIRENAIAEVKGINENVDSLNLKLE